MGDFEALLSMATKTHEKTSSQPSYFKSTQVIYWLNHGNEITGILKKSLVPIVFFKSTKIS